MGQVSNGAAVDSLHTDLCAAIADLAKSVDVAVTRMALRAKFTAAIADADKVERAAEFLRVVATPAPEKGDENEVTLVPLLAKTSIEQITWSANGNDCDMANELYCACRWLVAVQAPRVSPHEEGYREESKIAMRVLELQDRLGGLIDK